MDCRILRQVMVKADGHLCCDDSKGYKIDLGLIADSPGWRLKDILQGPLYQHIRSSFANSRMPWPDTCEICDLFSRGAQPHDTLDTRVNLLIEPTLACGLSCACCIRKSVIAKGRDTNSLRPELITRLIESCQRDNIQVGEIQYIGQGEPLLHDNFTALFNAVKHGSPESMQVVTTTGNVDFESTIANTRPDRIVVSCDGTRQATYEKYRRGGNLAQVMKFMRDCKTIGQPGIVLEWKYILFEHNDQDEEILEAQAIADEIGVDSLLFIVTNSKWQSTRFTVSNIHEFPLVSKAASISPAAALGAIDKESYGLTGRPPDKQSFGVIDVCNFTVGNIMNVEGWALDISGKYATRMELLLDGQVVADLSTGFQRTDVARVHEQAQGPHCGFVFKVPVAPDNLPRSVVVRVIGPSGTALLGGVTQWLSAGERPKVDVEALPARAPSLWQSIVLRRKESQPSPS